MPAWVSRQAKCPLHHQSELISISHHLNMPETLTGRSLHWQAGSVRLDSKQLHLNKHQHFCDLTWTLNHEGKKKKTSVQWVTRGTLTPYSYKRPVGCVAVREDKKNEEPHLGPVWRNVVFVCVCVFQALDLCHIIKILLSIKVEKVKWPSASSKQLDPPEHAYSHLALKKALRSNQFSEAQLNQREFTEMQYKMQWDLGSNKTLTHVIPKLQTATHIHRKPALSYTLIIYRQTLMEVCVIYSFQL